MAKRYFLQAHISIDLAKEWNRFTDNQIKECKTHQLTKVEVLSKALVSYMEKDSKNKPKDKKNERGANSRR